MAKASIDLFYLKLSPDRIIWDPQSSSGDFSGHLFDLRRDFPIRFRFYLFLVISMNYSKLSSLIRVWLFESIYSRLQLSPRALLSSFRSKRSVNRIYYIDEFCFCNRINGLIVQILTGSNEWRIRKVRAPVLRALGEFVEKVHVSYSSRWRWEKSPNSS